MKRSTLPTRLEPIASSVSVIRATNAMPAPLPEGKARKIATAFRVTETELRQLQKTAAERGATVSDLVREGLRMQGALPS